MEVEKEVSEEVQKILGTREHHQRYYSERYNRREIAVPNTDALWLAQPRQFPGRCSRRFSE